MSSPRIVSVAGGKGGVGKSVVAANLAVAFAQRGASVILIDCDFGAANQHSLFGFDRAVPTLHQFFEREVANLEELASATTIAGLRLIPGSFGIAGAANIAHAQKQKLLRHIRALRAEIVVVDIGAGVSFNAIDLFAVGAVRLVVTTPQLPSVQNAYSFLKGAVVRQLEKLGASDEEKAQILAAGKTQNGKITTWLSEIRDPILHAAIRHELERFGVHLVGNQIMSNADRNVLFAIERMVRDFLGVTTPVIGMVPHSDRLHESVNRRAPLLTHTRRDECAKALRQIAERVIELPIAADADPTVERVVEPSGPVESVPLPALKAFARRHPRYPVRSPATYCGADCELEEISVGGALVRAARPLILGQEGWLEMRELRGQPRLWAVVRNHRSEDAYGLEFLEESPEARRIVELLVEDARRLKTTLEWPKYAP